MKKFSIFLVLILSNLSIYAEGIKLSCSPKLTDSELILKAFDYGIDEKIEFGGSQALDPSVPSYKKELSNRQELIEALQIFDDSKIEQFCYYYNCPEYLTLFPVQKFSSSNNSIDVEADESEIIDGNYLLSGNVKLNSDKLFLSGDEVKISSTDDTILANGNVKFQDNLYLITGDKLTADRKDGEIIATAINASYQDYSIGHGGANGYTEFIEKTPNSVLLNNSTYSLCPINKSDWLIEASQIKLDTDKNRGVADNALLKFYGVPIFYTPKYSWVLSGRGSGFLSPDYSRYKESGNPDTETSLRVPYYFNLAPDRDLLTALTLMSSRGIIYEGKYRQLLPKLNDSNTSKIEIETKYLSEDKITNLKRWLIDFSEDIDLSNKVNLSARFYRVSDSKFFEQVDRQNTDVERLISFFKYSFTDIDDNLSFHVLTEDEQIVNSGSSAYTRSLEASASKTLNAESKMPIQLDLVSTRFDHDTPSKESGIRTHGNFSVLRESNITYPKVTPRASVAITNYSLKNSPNINRTIFGTGLDIDFTTINNSQLFGYNVYHTISPLITYNYRAKKVQGNIPLFDSTDKYDDIISFSDLTSGERYTGLDRITNANDITLSLQSNYRRVTALENDKDLLSLKVAQTYYTDDEVVSDSANTNYETRKSYSDIVASIDLAIDKFSISSAVQYNPKKSKVEKNTNTISYSPKPKQFISLSINDEGTKETKKIYGAYPLTNSIHVFGGLDKITSTGVTNAETAGIAYESCCWAFRIAHFKDDNSSGGYNHSTGMELVFTGLGSSTSNLQNKIRNKIPGYSTDLR